jgi:hypothetical protein
MPSIIPALFKNHSSSLAFVFTEENQVLQKFTGIVKQKNSVFRDHTTIRYI